MSIELKLSHSGRDGGLHYWLLDGGNAVSYAKVYFNLRDGLPVVELCDIETRADVRNRGYGTLILSMIANVSKVERVSHSGSYTPDGYSYISSKLHQTAPLTESRRISSSMSFVHSWDDLQPKYG